MQSCFHSGVLTKANNVNVEDNGSVDNTIAAQSKNDTVQSGSHNAAHVYLVNRQIQLDNLLKINADTNPNQQTLYPNRFNMSKSIEEFVNEYNNKIEPGQKLMNIVESVSGRILSVRKSSSKLCFLTIRNGDATSTLQIMLSQKAYNDVAQFDLITQILKRGDYIGAIGHPCKTGSGELSLMPKEVIILSPCLHLLPDAHSSTSLLDPEIRYRNRALDFIIHHAEVIPHFQTRSNILTFLRIFLQSRDFVEVETPILSLQSGGAAARPFVTHLNSMGGNTELKLRIAPELYLKELVIGGMERVFELGKVFRNEGIDSTHNPEFTSCEFYMAHADYNDLMKFTEELFRGCAMFIHTLKNSKKIGSKVIEKALQIAQNPHSVDNQACIIQYTMQDKHSDEKNVVQIDLSKPFKRISYLDSIEEETGLKLPRDSELCSPEMIQKLIHTCKQHDIQLDSSRTGDVSYLLDRLLSHLVEPKCIQPTFICDHPIMISPLAKSHEKMPLLTERFELFIAGREICNAYTELNDPMEQRRRFEQQAKAKEEHGDAEAHEKDENFCRALEYGLPPTGGWGCGIDRLVMLLTDTWNIRDVLLFPMMKPKESTHIELTSPNA
jgi:lysyl-tRNA synthetase class 2